MLSDTIGLAGTIEKLFELLCKLLAWLDDDGKLILDCSDIEGEAKEHAEDHQEHIAKQVKKAYVGETDMHFVKGARVGSTFYWLYLSFEKLKEMAEKAGWNCFLLQKEDNEFLVEMNKKKLK